MAAAEKIITANLDIWSSAIKSKSAAGRGKSNKLELYGINKLRELILELAVRGLLVPQDPNDEPASELLKKIAVEKARLVKDGKFRKQKALPPVEEDEQLFELPVGWEWCRLADAAFSQAGFAFKSKSFNESGDGLPLIRIRDVGQPFSGTFYDGEYRDEFVVKKGDYLISMDGNFRVAPWEGADALLNQRVSRLIFFGDLLGQRFIAESLQLRLSELQGVKAYTTVDHLSGGQISSSVIALPPSREQYRIVAKVDELMALCDQLEQQQETSITAHQTLVQTLLDALTTDSERDGFTAAWERIDVHFDALFTTEWSIDQLKQTILQLAVTGKLVPQDPNDEPASELLKKIAAEKVKLVKEGKIKKQKALPPIEGDEMPFGLPEGWELARFGSLINLVSGQHLKPAEYSEAFEEGMIPYLTGPAEFGERYPEPSRYTLERRAVANAGDLLITCKGSGVGKLNEANQRIFISRQLMAIQPFVISSSFAMLLAASLNEHLRENIVGIAIPGISREDVTEAVILVPPNIEQHRIVAKVDELMVLCDTLRTRLNTAQTTQFHLADAMTEKTIG